MELKIKALDARIGREIPAPRYATDGAAAMDICACLDAPLTIPAGERAVIPTGIAIALPSKEYVALMFVRSGLGIKKGICLSNEDYTIMPGDRISQLMVVPVMCPVPVFVDELDETERGEGGLGSTGR